MKTYITPKRHRRNNLHQSANLLQEFNVSSREWCTDAGQVPKVAQNRAIQHNALISEETAGTDDGSNGHHSVSGHVLHVVSHVVQEDLWEQGFEWS